MTKFEHVNPLRSAPLLIHTQLAASSSDIVAHGMTNSAGNSSLAQDSLKTLHLDRGGAAVWRIGGIVRNEVHMMQRATQQISQTPRVIERVVDTGQHEIFVENFAMTFGDICSGCGHQLSDRPL